ncbi:hypothetical protein SBC1_77940 (plasmid) [Caballeronia sp. SBC1]|nr:hypothetical protein SBC2_81160 [Caballeronia sp. SBC2]QIN67747.1 hypothetical protein SBC1_77940 [Caballeronia sp. SBC1]
MDQRLAYGKYIEFSSWEKNKFVQLQIVGNRSDVHQNWSVNDCFERKSSVGVIVLPEP